MVGAALALDLSGLDYLRAIAERRIPPPPIAVLLGMGIVDVQPGRVAFSLEVGEHLYNPIGSVHGGVFCTLLDSRPALTSWGVPGGAGHGAHHGRACEFRGC
jgi:acyl-coenzyme A thioesterase PaaI-like protein